MNLKKIRYDAEMIFQSAIKEVDPYTSVKKHLSFDGASIKAGSCEYDISLFKKIVLLGAGKASARMAKAVEDILGDKIDKSFVVVKYDHSEPLRITEILEAGHPLPDGNGIIGAKKILDIAEESDTETLIIFLVSGGGSALTPQPIDSISLEEKQQITNELLSSGATIHEINTIRKKLM